MTVNSLQRFTRNRPCPVCNGRDGDQRGRGKRCFGFLSDNDDYAHCTRPEYAGQLEINSKSATFPHRLAGDCKCGNTHGLEAPTSSKHNVQRTDPIADTYDYTDEDGNFLFQVVRYDPKDFKQRHIGGKGGWIWNLNGVRRVLYRLPELMAADPAKPVFIVEGEKDANRLIQQGLIATTNPMGAGKWLPEYFDFLTEILAILYLGAAYVGPMRRPGV